MRVIALLVALSSVGCGLTGPSEDLTGHWIARGAPLAAFVYGFTLQQSGDTISGTACAKANGVLSYSGVPVTGEYPNLQFTAPPGQRFMGKQDGSKDIVGSYGSIDLRFERSQTSLCN